MKTLKPIKTDVFSFTTLRSPQQVEFKKKALNFVLHPDLEASYFLASKSRGKADRKTDAQIQVSDFQPIKTYSEVRKMQTNLYDFSDWLVRNKFTLTKRELLERGGKIKRVGNRDVLKLWDQLFYQLVSKKSKYVQQSITQVLIANHVLSHLEEIELTDEFSDQEAQQIANAWVVIPQEVADQIEYEGIIKGCELFGVKKLGLIIYRKVEQELLCYVPGEVSRIENILAREYKERHTRDFISTRNTTESTFESEMENVSDTATTDRNELQTEIGRLMDKQTSFGIGGGVTASYGKKDGPYNITGNIYADFASNNAISTSNNIAKNYAQEITRAALERVLQRITRKRTSTIVKEFEENNRHGFDNRKGSKHVTGVYRWVDKIYKNNLVNYGKRLVYEIMIPEPSKFYKFVEEYEKPSDDTSNGNDSNPTSPTLKPLKDFGIGSASDITKDNYAGPATEYGTTISSPPSTELKEITKSFSHEPEPERDDFTMDHMMMIPEGFRAYQANGKMVYYYQSRAKPRGFIRFFVGSQEYAKTDLTGKDTKEISFTKIFAPQVTGSLDIGVAGLKIFNYTLNITVKCQSTAALEAWQIQTYNTLQSAYEEKLSEIEAENAAAQIEPEERPSIEESNQSSNPALNRIIEQNEIKRVSIEMLTNCLKFELGKDFYTEDISCGDAKSNFNVIQNKEFAEYIEHVKFLEQAFDWGIMSYEFLPYYWADKCNWIELLKIKDENDLLFKAFKQCGMARVLVPVSQGFEEATIYYLQTGDVWTGGDLVVGSEDDLTISILTDLNQEEGVVEDSWETRVPTTLTIVQAESAVLKEGGLPCYQSELPEEDQVITNIESSLELIGGNPEPESQPEPEPENEIENNLEIIQE